MALGTPILGTIFYNGATNPASLTPSYPSGIQSGDCLVLVIGFKPNSANSGSVTTPSGWTLRESLTAAGGYGTTLGTDTGNTNLYFYTKDTVTGSESGTLTVSVSTVNSAWAAFIRIPSGVGSFSYDGADGQRTTTPTSSLSVTLNSASISAQAGDVFITAMCIPTDITTPNQFTNSQTTISGLTVSNAELGEPDSSTGADVGGFIGYSTVTAGTATGNPVFTATLAGTLTNVRGPVITLRVREFLPIDGDTTETVTAAADQDATYILGDVTVDETVNALEAQTSSISYDVDITETVSATDAQTAEVVKDADITESVTATDSQDAVTPANADITEAVSASDAETAVDIARAWITESNNTFGSTPPVYDTATTYADFTSTTVLGSVFVARASGTVKTVSIFGRRGATYTSGSIDVQIWQLASNSPSALPQTLLGTVSVPYTAVNGGAGAQTTYLLDISTANASLVSGTYYAVVLRNSTLSSTFYWSNYTTEFNPITVPYSIAAGVVSASVFFNGTSWSSNSNGFLPATVYLTNNTADTQDGSVLADAAITEAVTATETETAGNVSSVSQTESVTATDSETGSVDLTAAQSESVTATDSETSQLDANADITESVLALDSESASKEYNVDEAESVTATDDQIAGLAQDVSQDETVTATGSEDATTATTSAITESVTASDAETAVDTARAWINEGDIQQNTLQGFALSAVTTSNSGIKIAQSFVANKSGVLGNVSVGVYRASATNPLPSGDGTVELWQLDSNSVSGVPQTLLDSVPMRFSILSTSSSNIANYYFGNVSLTQGVGYAIVIVQPSGVSASTSHIGWSYTGASLSNPTEYNYLAAFNSGYRTNTTGVWNAPATRILKVFASLEDATDTESATYTTPAAITESVTATDEEDAIYAVAVDQNESVTATDTEDGIVAFNSFVTESVTADTTQTNTLTARGAIDEGGVLVNTLYTGSANAASSSTAFGIAFTAAKTVAIETILFGVYRATTSVADPTLALYQDNTLVASVTVPYTQIGTSSGSQTTVTVADLGFNLVSGLSYTIRLIPVSGHPLIPNYYNQPATNNSFSPFNVYIASAAGIFNYPTNDTRINIFRVMERVAVETQLPGLAYQVAQDEAALALDSEDAVFALPVDITETVTATDSEDSNAAMGVAQDEAVTAADSEEANTPQNAAQDESVTATDTETTTADYAVNQTETVTATDTETVNYSTSAAITESVTATESNVVYVDFTAAITETLSLTDSQSVVAVLPVSITEAVAANDSCVAESSVIFTVTGVQGTTQLGTAAVATDQILSVTGVQATGYLGTATTTGAAVVNLTGVYGTGQLGTASVVLDQFIDVTGVTAQGAVGTVALVTNNFINVTGVQGATQLGTATAFTNNTVSVTGVQATSAVGSVSVIIGQFVNVSGVQANIILNKVNVWGDIVPTPTGPWSNVNDSQTNNWVIIDKAA